MKLEKNDFLIAGLFCLFIPLCVLSMAIFRFYKCSENPFNGLHENSLMLPRLAGNHINEDLIQFSKRITGPIFLREPIINQSQPWLEDMVICNSTVLEDFQNWFGKPDQVFLREPEQSGIHRNFHYVNFDERNWRDDNLVDLLNTKRIGKLLWSKCYLELKNNRIESAKVWANYAFSLAAYLTKNQELESFFAAKAIYLEGFSLLSQKWPKAYLNEAMLAWLPHQNEWEDSFEKAIWQTYLIKADFLRAFDAGMVSLFPYELKFHPRKLRCSNLERTLRYSYENYLAEKAHGQGPWLDSLPLPSENRSFKETLFGRIDDGYYEYLNFFSHQSEFLHSFLGTLLVRAARMEVDIYLSIEGMKPNRENTARILGKNSLENPFTKKPYRLDDMGNFLITRCEDIPDYGFDTTFSQRGLRYFQSYSLEKMETSANSL